MGQYQISVVIPPESDGIYRGLNQESYGSFKTIEEAEKLLEDSFFVRVPGSPDGSTLWRSLYPHGPGLVIVKTGSPEDFLKALPPR